MQILSQELQDYINGICCPPIVLTPNFDVTADWAGTGIVVDEASFYDFITVGGGYPGTTVTMFSMVGDRIVARIDGTFELGMPSLVTKIDSLPGTIIYFNLGGGNTLTQAELDYAASQLLSETTLKFWNTSGGPFQPSSANKAAIDALTTSNGGSATF